MVPPADYEGLIALIHARHPAMSETYQSISVYLTQNPNDVAVQSLNAVAGEVGVHPSSFVRFAQSLGYSGYRDLQRLFRQRLATAAPGFEARLRELERELASRGDASELTFLHEMVVQDVASLQSLIDDIDPDALARAADLIAGADTVFVLGQLRAAPIAILLRYTLTMLGKRVVLLDAAGGLATHLAHTMTAGDVLVAVSFRFYAHEVVSIVDAVNGRVPIVAVTDSTLSPLAKHARVLFAVPERGRRLGRSLAAPICLVQALLVTVAARLQGDSDDPVIPIVTDR